MPELFNQTPETTADVNKRLAFGEPSQTGAFNILISNFFIQIKKYLLGTGNANKITSYTFTASDYWTFEPDQYEMVLYINARFTTATSIKVGTLIDPEAYISETTNTSNNVGIYCDSPNVSDRSINIALNGSGLVTIISIKNV